MTNATDPSAALVAANEAFYDAFDMGDYQAMAAVWAADHPVACVHPGSETIMGRDAVLRSWHDILSASSRPAIQCLEPKPMLFQQVGLVVCIEALAGGRLAASNLFVMESGHWRMVHHQAGPLNTVVPLSGPRQN